VAAAAMADTTELRMTRLESDAAHIRSDVADLKIDGRELRREFGELRKEFGELRKEFGEVRIQLGDMRREIMRGLLHTRIWMLLLCAAMLGVMARGLHWL